MFSNVLNGTRRKASVLKYGAVDATFSRGALLVPFGLTAFWKRRRQLDVLFPIAVSSPGDHGAVAHGCVQFLSVVRHRRRAGPVMLAGLLPVPHWITYALFFLQALWVTGSYTCNLSGVKTDTRQQLEDDRGLRLAARKLTDDIPSHARRWSAVFVFARRDYGHLLVRHAHQPVVVSPFRRFSGAHGRLREYVFSDSRRRADPRSLSLALPRHRQHGQHPPTSISRF